MKWLNTGKSFKIGTIVGDYLLSLVDVHGGYDSSIVGYFASAGMVFHQALPFLEKAR